MRKIYEPPAVIYEAALEVRAGTPLVRRGSTAGADHPIRDALLGAKWDAQDKLYRRK